MKKRTIRIASIAIAAAIGVSLSACSSSTGSTGSDQTLTIYGWKGNEAQPAGVPEINAAFEAANPGVTVNYEFIDAGATIAQRLQPELLAGTGPDVFMVTSSEITQYQGNGYLTDLSDEPWVSTISDQVKPFVEADGATYAVPLGIIPIGLWANMDVLGQAGITTFPTTYSELIGDLETLKAAGITGLSVPNKGAYTADALLNGIASTLVYRDNPQWDANFMSGSTDFSDWKPSVDQLVALGDDGLVDWKSSLGVDEWGQGLQDFKAGKSAFLYQGGWNLADFQTAIPSVQFGPWPASNEGPQWATMFAGVNWAVNAASDKQELAKKYLAFWADSENDQEFLEAEASYSPFDGGTSPTNDATTLIADAVGAGDYRLLAATTWFPQTNEDEFGQDLQSLFLGQTTTDDLLSKWDSFREK